MQSEPLPLMNKPVVCGRNYAKSSPTSVSFGGSDSISVNWFIHVRWLLIVVWGFAQCCSKLNVTEADFNPTGPRSLGVCLG